MFPKDNMTLRDFGKKRFIVVLPKLFDQRILAKLCYIFATDNILFYTLTFGALFRLVNNEGLDLCNELKVNGKYGSERAQSRREMENFCEAFGI